MQFVIKLLLRVDDDVMHSSCWFFVCMAYLENVEPHSHALVLFPVACSNACDGKLGEGLGTSTACDGKLGESLGMCTACDGKLGEGLGMSTASWVRAWE